MRILVQRIREGWVDFPDSTPTARAEHGILALTGFSVDDDETLLEPMAAKMVHLRIFADAAGRMNDSLLDSGGALLLVPQFTLYADCRKGRRPGFSAALAPEPAKALFQRFEQVCRAHLPEVICGRFGAEMRVHLVNDGPVTILLDSAELGLMAPVF